MAGELIAQFTDHEGRVSRFVEQFRNKPDLEALARSYLKQLQDLEDAIFEIILERNLDDSVGAQLTTIADIVGQPRTTPDDARFRTAIRARIRINLSHATAEDVMSVLRLLLQTNGEVFEFRDEPPAQFRITIVDPLSSADADLVHELLDAADPAGVRFMLDYNTALSAFSDKFVFADEASGDAGGGGGFDSTTGGATGTGSFSSTIGG